MKRYKIEFDLFEGSDEFWEELKKLSETGREQEVELHVRECLNYSGFIPENMTVTESNV